MEPTGKNKKNKRKDSESSTPQSSVPSVDDDDQKLLQRGACASSYSYQSESAVKSKSTVKRKNSESSTTQSSVLSVDDEEKLPQGGPSRSSSSRQSRSREKSTRVAKSTVSGDRSPNRSLFSRNAPESSPGKNSLTVPAQESGIVGPGSSPKKGFFTQLTERLSPKKRSQSPSTDSKCRCKSKANHKTDCPESNKIEADAKRKSPERPNESKASSSIVSSVISTEKVEGAQSSSSSDPRVEECSNTLLSEKLMEMSLLSVPEKAKVTVSPKSPRKKGILAQIAGKFSPKKRSPNHSPLRCVCTNRNDHDLQCPERGKQEADSMNSSRSQTSSSSASPTSKKKQSDASYTSSENSRLSSSKSSSTSGANVKKNTPDKKNPKKSGKKPVSDESRKKYDPSVSSRDSAGHAVEGIQIDVDNSLKMWFKSFKSNPRNVVGEPVIENLDDALPEELEKPEDATSRRRSKSFGSNVRVSQRRSLLARQSNVKSEDEDALQGDGSNADSQAIKTDPSVKPKVKKDGGDTTNTQREDGVEVPPPLQIAEGTRVRPITKRESLSPYPLEPCGCGDRYIHEIGCSREKRARQRRNWRRCRQTGIDPKSEQRKESSKKP